LPSSFGGSLEGLDVPRSPLPPLTAVSDGKEASVPDPGDFLLEAARHFGTPPIVEKPPSGKAPAEAPTDGEMSDNVRKSPRWNAEREKLVEELFVKAGARPQKLPVGNGQNNFLAVKPGRTDRILVVGGHHDKVSVGQGTIDNWTGATMVVHLYQLLKDAPTEHTIYFMTFGREEEGLVGSSQYVRTLPPEVRSKMDAMINLDTLAVDGTFSWKNNSDRPLLDAVAEAAREGGFQLVEQRLWGGDSDSSSFRRAGIPAMTLFGASPDIIWDILHSENDNFSHFSIDHYRNIFYLTAALLKRLDPKPGRPGLAQAFSPN